MSNEQNQPGEFDAVLGGEAPPPLQGAVLGGIEGVKRRLASSSIETQTAALKEALNYREVGLDLVISALQNESVQIQYLAANLLKQNQSPKGKVALLDYNPRLYFTKVSDWEKQSYYPWIAIPNQFAKAYIVNPENCQSLLQNPNINQIEALIFQISFHNRYNSSKAFDTFVKTVSDTYKQFTNLKAVYIGDGHVEDRNFMEHSIENSSIELGDVTPILKANPQLEVLHIYGRSGLQIKPIRHNSLKTLILQIHLLFIDSNIFDISKLDLPALEYIELWFGGNQREGKNVVIKHLLPTLNRGLFPNIKYLGLRNSYYTDDIALSLVEASSLVEQLSILDISIGILTDKGAEILLNSPSINKLKMLILSKNEKLSEQMIQKLYNLECEVIVTPPNIICGF